MTIDLEERIRMFIAQGQLPPSVLDEYQALVDRAVVAERERDALRHAADRFLSCVGEFDGDASFCNEYADALESLVVNGTAATTGADDTDR